MSVDHRQPIQFVLMLFIFVTVVAIKENNIKKNLYTHIFFSILPALAGWYIYSKVIWTVGCQLTFLIMPHEMVTQYLTVSLADCARLCRG